MHSDTTIEFNRITVADLLKAIFEDLRIKVYAGIDGLDKPIIAPRIQKPGLAYRDYLDYLQSDRIQILGSAEFYYLKSLDKINRAKSIKDYCSKNHCCIVLTEDVKPFDELIDESEKRKIPLFVSSRDTSYTIETINRQLKSLMAPQSTAYGVLMEIFGLGVLIRGKPGIGKSEAALDLVTRGHRLVADDAIILKKFDKNVLVGFTPQVTCYLLEIRGLGIINIRDLFGMGSVRQHKKIQLIVELEMWKPGTTYDRLGFNETHYKLMDTSIPSVKIPVAPGRHLSVLIETAARNHLVKSHQGSSALKAEKKISKEILRRSQLNQKNGK